MQILYPDMESPNLTSPSINERRGRRLAPLQTNFSRPAAHLNAKGASVPRSRSTDCRDGGDDTANGPGKSEPVRKQNSKTGLRSLFGRKGTDQSKLSGIEETRGGVVAVEDGQDTPLSTSCPTPSTIASATTAVPSSPDTPRAAVPRSKSRIAKETSHRAETVWRPPPLSLASPHALRRDCLWCPSLDADVILRFRDAESKANAQEGDTGTGASRADGAGDENSKRRHKKISKGSSNALGGTLKFSWSQKIYLLTPSGYILQYAGEGKEDRLPEKMMLLGPASVAFASDAVPGKHFVVQISQSQIDEALTAVSESTKPLLSRFGFQRATSSTRNVRNFLLVCSNADKMNAWLMEIREQIEAQGGKKYISEKSPGLQMMQIPLPNDSRPRQPTNGHPKRSSSLFLQPDRPPTFRQHGLNQSSQDSIAPSFTSSFYSTDHRSMLSTQPADIDDTTLSEAVADLSCAPSERSIASVSGIKHSFSSGPLSPPPAPGGATNAELLLTRTLPDPSASVTSKAEQQSNVLSSPSGADAGMTRLPIRPSNLPQALARSTSPPAPNFSVPLFSSRFVTRTGQASDSKAASHSTTADVGGPLGRQDAPLSPVETTGTDVASLKSPPLSPVRSVTSIRQDSTGDQRLMSPDSLPRPLHISNSEGSLREAIRKNDDQTQFSAKAPKSSPSSESIANTTSPSSSTHPMQSQSCGAKAPMLDQPPSQKPRDELAGTSNAQRIKSVTPTQPADNNNNNGRRRCILRRKSMAEISLGPPSGPPPNCPLPKLPPNIVVGNKTRLSEESTTTTTTATAAGAATSTRVPKSPPPPLAGVVSPPPRRSSLFLRS